jgi:hypothetical protein
MRATYIHKANVMQVYFDDVAPYYRVEELCDDDSAEIEHLELFYTSFADLSLED